MLWLLLEVVEAVVKVILLMLLHNKVLPIYVI
jgi:hypothetical protein